MPIINSLTDAIRATDVLGRDRPTESIREETAHNIWRQILTYRTDPHNARIRIDVQMPPVVAGGQGPTTQSPTACTLEVPNPFVHADLREAPTLEAAHFALTTLREIAEMLAIDLAERKANCPVTQQFYSDVWDYVWPLGAQGFANEHDRVWWRECLEMCGQFIELGEQALREVTAGLALPYEEIVQAFQRVIYQPAWLDPVREAEAISARSRALSRAFCQPHPQSDAPLDGSSCVEEWDPDFDPRSILIKDL